MTEYKVKSQIKHDGEVFEKGATIKLNQAEAQTLLDDGIIVDLKDDVEETEPETPQPAVNVVKRKNAKGGTKGAGTTDAEQVVEPGKIETPQPGDDEPEDDDAGTTDAEDDSDKL
jgi:hypothetical protein